MSVRVPMVFESTHGERITAAIASSLMGIFAITHAVMVPESPEFLFFAAIALFLTGACLATWRTFIHIQDRHRRVTKITTVLLWSRSRHYPFSCFQHVGIGTGGSGGPLGGGEAVFRVRLVGSPNLLFPGSETSRPYVMRMAEDLALEMDLPIDPRPRSILFPGRL